MTTRALKRDLAALERDYGEDDDRSPKARAAEAQRVLAGSLTSTKPQRDRAIIRCFD